MHTEKVKSNEKQPENRVRLCFLYFLLYISSCAATPLNEIYLVFIFGAQKYFLYSFYKDNWRGRVKDNEVNLIDDIECKYKD